LQSRQYAPSDSPFTPHGDEHKAGVTPEGALGCTRDKIGWGGGNRGTDTHTSGRHTSTTAQRRAGGRPPLSDLTPPRGPLRTCRGLSTAGDAPPSGTERRGRSDSTLSAARPGRRVGPGVGPRAAHTSLHSQQRHTARQVTASLPRYAIRGRCVDKVLRVGVPALSPDRGSVTRPSLPSAGSSYPCVRLPQGPGPACRGASTCWPAGWRGWWTG
jgi:hypothetical protein